MAPNVQTILGRVTTNPPVSADPVRYRFLSLPNAEPNLYLPAKTGPDSSKYFLLSNPLTGERFWSNNILAVNGNKIGIGTELPSEILSVVGNISATGNIYGNVVTPIVPSAAGLDTYVQFNSGGLLGADAGFVYKTNTRALQVGFGSNTSGTQASIAGGFNNTAAGNFSFIGSGDTNNNSSVAGVIGGGKGNLNTGDYSFIGGGRENETNDIYSAVAGGYSNEASGLGTFIGGGEFNTIAAGTSDGAILGGLGNTVNHNNSFILGSGITSTSANYTYVENLDIKNHIVLNASVAERYSALTPLSNVVDINLDNGTTFNVTLTANINSFNITNFLLNRVNSFALFLNQDNTGGKTVSFTFTGKTLKWNQGNVPLMTSAANATDFYTFITNDGGSTWFGFTAGQNFS
jgi:hypothetical protein